MAIWTTVGLLEASWWRENTKNLNLIVLQLHSDKTQQFLVYQQKPKVGGIKLTISYCNNDFTLATIFCIHIPAI